MLGLISQRSTNNIFKRKDLHKPTMLCVLFGGFVHAAVAKWSAEHEKITR